MYEIIAIFFSDPYDHSVIHIQKNNLDYFWILNFGIFINSVEGVYLLLHLRVEGRLLGYVCSIFNVQIKKSLPVDVSRFWCSFGI